MNGHCLATQDWVSTTKWTATHQVNGQSSHTRLWIPSYTVNGYCVATQDYGQSTTKWMPHKIMDTNPQCERTLSSHTRLWSPSIKWTDMHVIPHNMMDTKPHNEWTFFSHTRLWTINHQVNEHSLVTTEGWELHFDLVGECTVHVGAIFQVMPFLWTTILRVSHFCGTN